MAEQAVAPASADVTSIIAGMEQVVGRFVGGLDARVSALADTGQELAALHASFAAGGTSAAALALKILLVVVVTAGVFLVCRRWFWRADAGGWRRLFSALAAALVAVVAGVVVQRLLPAEGPAVRTLRIWIVVTVAGLLAIVAIRALLTKSDSRRVGRLAALARDLSVALGWSFFGMAFMATLRLWGAGPGLRDAFSSLALALPAFALFIWAVWRHRKTMAAAVAGMKPRSRWRGWLARLWPGLVIGFLIVTFLTAEIALTLRVPLPGGAVLFTVVIVLLTPHLDALIANRANLAMEAERASVIGVALRQTARFAVLVVMLTMLGAIWASPLASGFGLDLGSIAREALHVALIATAAAFLWSLLVTAMARIAHADGRGTHDAAASPQSRLGTLVPLISITGKSAIVALAFLTALVSVGVNVWPLITGLSVFGLAIGFGSQTLVKDIVSGLFFLADDAFRIGEYIETSGAKGTVEKISVRSVTLRNARGPVATVPYGQISKVVNFSRDYSIEKIEFRVAFDTDVELVRKLFKKIGQDILADPELAPHILETFKSQGILNVEDGTLVVRGKFVAKPGNQTIIRRAVFKAVLEAFRENGIRAVPKPLTGDPVAAV